MARSRTMKLGGWGNCPVVEAAVYRPHKPSIAGDILRQRDHLSYIPRGLGRSYGDAAVNDHAVIQGDWMPRMLEFDAEAGELEAEAGVSLKEILDVIVPRGWFPPVTPGTRHVTLGGAVAADVHGKNHHIDGSFVSCVMRFELMLPNGNVVSCSRGENADLFYATLGGMGLTGLILTVRIKLLKISSAYMRVTRKRCTNLEETLNQIDANDDQFRYSVAWVDFLGKGEKFGRSVLILGEHAEPDMLKGRRQKNPLHAKPIKQKKWPWWMPTWALNRMTARWFNALQHWKQPDGVKIEDYGKYFYPLDVIADWNKAYGKRGFVQYQCVMPKDTAREGLAKIYEKLQTAEVPCYLAVLKAMGAASDGWLSFPIPGYTLTMDFPVLGEKLWSLLGALDQITLDAGGRVYLAKDAAMSRETFETMYPRLGEFKQLRERIDPANVMGSTQSRRLGITPELARDADKPEGDAS